MGNLAFTTSRSEKLVQSNAEVTQNPIQLMKKKAAAW